MLHNKGEGLVEIDLADLSVNLLSHFSKKWRAAGCDGLHVCEKLVLWTELRSSGSAASSFTC